MGEFVSAEANGAQAVGAQLNVLADFSHHLGVSLGVGGLVLGRYYDVKFCEDFILPPVVGVDWGEADVLGDLLHRLPQLPEEAQAIGAVPKYLRSGLLILSIREGIDDEMGGAIAAIENLLIEPYVCGIARSALGSPEAIHRLD